MIGPNRRLKGIATRFASMRTGVVWLFVRLRPNPSDVVPCRQAPRKDNNRWVLFEPLPTLKHDPNRTGDVLKADADEDGIGGDETADALRYLVATKPRILEMRRLRGL